MGYIATAFAFGKEGLAINIPRKAIQLENIQAGDLLEITFKIRTTKKEQQQETQSSSQKEEITSKVDSGTNPEVSPSKNEPQTPESTTINNKREEKRFKIK